jgi:hypothetical protein
MVGFYEHANKLFSFVKGRQLLDNQAVALELLVSLSLPDLLFVVPNFTDLLPYHVPTLRHL